MRHSWNRVLFTLAVIGGALLPAAPVLAQKGKPQPPPPPPIVYSLTVLNGMGPTRWTGLNDHGDVVGTIGTVTSRVAVVWPAGSTDPIELNSFVDPELDVALVTATGINNSGQICTATPRSQTP